MTKNIAICCDGTANEFAKDRTNVIKLYSVLEHDPASQVTYYHPGLGTLEPVGALSPVAPAVHARGAPNTRSACPPTGYGSKMGNYDA